MRQFQTTPGAAMEYRTDQSLSFATFDQRRIRPCVCVVERKQHIRSFLRDALEEFDLITCDADSREMDGTLKMQLADLVVLGPSEARKEGADLLETLATNKFTGKVLLLGPRTTLDEVQEFGEKIGLAMLPALPTPFGSGNLRDRVVMVLTVMGHLTVRHQHSTRFSPRRCQDSFLPMSRSVDTNER
jgi:DNA-binding response OmpR family regulator